MQAAVADLGRLALTTAGTADEVFDAALPVVCRLLGVDAALVAEVDQGRGVMVHRAAYGLPSGTEIAPEASLAGSFSENALTPGEPFVCADLAALLPPGAAYLELGAVSAVGVVIRGHEGPFGVLNALSFRRREFGVEDTVFVSSVANILGAAVERDRLGRTLRQRDRLLENVLEHAPDVILRFDRELRHVFISDAVETVTGMPASAFIGRTNRELGMPEEACLLWERELLPVFETGKPVTFEFSFVGVAGERLFESRVVPETGPDGSVESLLVISRDITEADAARQELRASELRYRELFESAGDMIFLLDTDKRFVDVNPAVEQTLGLLRGELIGAELRVLLDASEREAADRRLREKLDGSVPATRYESLLRTRDGDEVPVEVGSRAIVRDGETVGVLAIARDLRERNRVLEELAESEELFRTAFDEAAVGMALVGRDLGYVRVNQAFADALGYTVEELERLSVADVSHPDDVDESWGWQRQLLAGGQRSFVREKQYLHRDGSTIWMQLGAASVLGVDGEIKYFVSQMQDITALKAVEQELRESQALHRLVVQNARDLIAVIGVDGRLRLVSSSVASNLGWTPDELIGMPFAELIHPDDLQTAQGAVAAALRGATAAPVRIRVARRHGGWRIFEAAGAAAYDENGSLDFVVVTANDVTEREGLEEQLRQAQKLEAIGKLAGGVAHDFNNLLTAINGYSDVVLTALDGDEDARIRHAVEEIRRAGERAAELTRQLLAFGRRQTLRPEVVSLNAIVDDYAGLLQRALGEDIAMKTVLEPRLAHVKADPGQLGQVLMNLAVNARDAMPGGGSLTIETSNVSLCGFHGLPDGRYVRLGVADTGDGIDPRIRQRIFDPFFTTKEPGSGTGLGLATVLGIVEQSGGAVEVESQDGPGAVFAVYLPETDEPAAPAADPEADPASIGSGTVLVVEDEEIVRELVTTMLREAGFRVVAAATAADALEIVAGERIDLLLTDVVMPGMNGRELAQHVLELRPGVRVLFTSGYAADVIADRGVLDPDDEFIQKPYPTAALVEAVNRMLAR